LNISQSDTCPVDNQKPSVHSVYGAITCPLFSSTLPHLPFPPISTVRPFFDLIMAPFMSHQTDEEEFLLPSESVMRKRKWTEKRRCCVADYIVLTLVMALVLSGIGVGVYLYVYMKDGDKPATSEKFEGKHRVRMLAGVTRQGERCLTRVL
jgi:hypothetical protein